MFNKHGLVSTVRFSVASFVILAAVTVAAVAQTPVPSASNAGSFRGRIIDADTGQPVIQEGVTIVVTKEGESAATRRVIDVKGEFIVPDLSPGRYMVQFRHKGLSLENQARYVQVTGLASITPVDIYLRLLAVGITGVVLDEDKEPVQGSQVMLVTVEYLSGQAVYTAYTTAKKTDDRGSFSLSARIEAGRPYFLLALPPEATRPMLSGTPSLEANWYPGHPGVWDPFVLRSDEQKRVDFVMKKSPSHCIDGTLMHDGQPAALDFEIAIPEVAGYLGYTGSTQGVIAGGRSDASGHFQACGLWPGEFLLAAGLDKNSYGRATVSVADKDVNGVTVNAHSPVSLTAEIHWDSGQMPDQGFRLQFIPFSRAPFKGDPNRFWEVANGTVPSQFTFFLPAFTDYVVGGGVIPMQTGSGMYIKEVTCGGTISRNLLKLGDTDCGLHITVGTDMGKLAATIVDKDNKPDLNSSVCAYPTSAVTREEIVATGTCSSADRGTTSVSIALRPDKYFAVVTPPGTIDWVEYIRTNRGQRELFEILARSASQLTLKSSSGR